MTDDPIFDRAATYEEGDRIVYRASSFGYCLGALVRSRMGMTASLPPEFMLEKFQEGHDWERRVLEAGLGVDWTEITDSRLERFGTIVEGQNGERQVEAEMSWGNKTVRVHPDAIVQHGADKHLRVCEVKFLGPDMYNAVVGRVEKDGMLGLGSGYAWQASIEMLATQLPMLYVIGQKAVDSERKVTGLAGPPICYEWTDPCYSFKDVKMRVAEVEGWVSRGALPPCVVPFDYPCGYWAEHPVEMKQEVTDEMLMYLVESYQRNASKGEAVATERDEIRKAIDARMGELGITSGVCAGWNISLTDNRPGNVSWKKAYDALAKLSKTSVDVDLYRGKEVEGGIRVEKVKTDE